MSGIKFGLLYLIPMFVTYILRPMFVIGSAQNGGEGVSLAGINITFLICYSVMILLTYKRGKLIDKNYIVVFPIIGALFDIILAFVPFIPTVMNVIVYVMGMPDNKTQKNN